MQRVTREKKDEELRLEKRVEGGDRSTHSLHSKLPQSVSPSVTGGGDGSGTLVRRCARASPMTSLRRKERGEKGDRKRMVFIGDGEPGITYLGITESGITESGITWVMGIGHNRNWYNGISYNMEAECGITESGITESGITRKFDSGIRHNNKL